MIDGILEGGLGWKDFLYFLFKPGPEFFDGIEIGRVRGQEEERASSIFNELSRFGGFVERSVVHDDGLPRFQLGKQDFFDPSLEKRCVAGAIKGHG